MRHTTTALITLALTIALSACSNTDETAPPPTPTPAASTTASAPTPPVMPRAARAHTEAGAKAFVRYFWDVVNYAQATGDTNAIAELSADGCVGCEVGIASVDEVYSNGGRILGGKAVVSGITVTFGWVEKTAVADVSFGVKFAPQVVIDQAGRHRGKARHARNRFNLTAEAGDIWHVTDFHVLA
jgi:hypothetical protein